MEIFNWQNEELQNISLCFVVLPYDKVSKKQGQQDKKKKRLEAEGIYFFRNILYFTQSFMACETSGQSKG